MTISVNSYKPNCIVLKIKKFLTNLKPSINHLSVISIFSGIKIEKDTTEL